MTSHMAYLVQQNTARSDAIESSARELTQAADELLKDLCARFGRNRSDLDGIPMRLDLAIKQMREVLL